MTNKLKKRLYRIISGAVLFALAIVLSNTASLDGNIELILFLIVYFIVGGDVVKKIGKNFSGGTLFDENFLMTVATVGAFLVGEYAEAVAVMLFYQVGEFFQSYAVNRSRKSISDLMDIRPDHANVKRNGEVEEVDPSEVSIGENIVVKPGERVPLDGKIIKGKSTLDTSQLTGESLPREAEEGDAIISGCINLNGVLEIETEKEYGESTVSKILDLVENAGSRKAAAENFITRFAKYYTPVVVFCALALAFVPLLLFGTESLPVWGYRALTFLVISCPCALVISVPLSFFGGIGGASSQGILVKGSNYLELLANTNTVIFDKTGTLTKGNFVVSKIEPQNMTKEELLEYAAYAESMSDHPISQSLKAAYGKEIDVSQVTDIEEIAGHGICAKVKGKSVLAGNGKLMKKQGIDFRECEEIGTVVYVAVEETYAGCLLIADEIKEDAGKAMTELKKAGVQKLVMLTGDSKKVGEDVAKKIGLDEVFTELLPADKVEKMEQILNEVGSKGKVAFVGDGINDAPVLARADVGIAMGGLGSEAAIEAADIVIMTDEPSKIAKAIYISRKTLGIVKQNIVFAIGVKVFVLLLAAVGFANMWAAIFADVGVTVLAVLNAIRALKVGKNK